MNDSNEPNDEPEPWVDPELAPYPYTAPYIEGIAGCYFGARSKDSERQGYLPYPEYAARYAAKTKETGEDWGGHLLQSLLCDLDEHRDHSKHDDAAYFYSPYCWCDREDCPLCNDTVAPFFHWKATDLRVRWYKRAGRSMRANRPWTAAEVAQIRGAIGIPEEPPSAPTVTLTIEASPSLHAQVKVRRSSGDDTGWGRMKALLARVRR